MENAKKQPCSCASQPDLTCSTGATNSNSSNSRQKLISIDQQPTSSLAPINSFVLSKGRSQTNTEIKMKKETNEPDRNSPPTGCYNVDKSYFFIGMRVVRGPDWKWDAQDSFLLRPGEGIIVSELASNNWVRVKWDNGNVYRYRVDFAKGIFDLALSPNADAIKKLSTTNTKVVRGPNWRYQEQDRKSTGNVIGPVNGFPGWVKVKWDKNGYVDNYRIGADQGKFDITVADSE